MGRSKEDIDQEYGQLCLQYGHLCQERSFLEREKIKTVTVLQSQIEDFSAQAEGKIVQINSELRKIESRWQELLSEIKDTQDSTQADGLQ